MLYIYKLYGFNFDIREFPQWKNNLLNNKRNLAMNVKLILWKKIQLVYTGQTKLIMEGVKHVYTIPQSVLWGGDHQQTSWTVYVVHSPPSLFLWPRSLGGNCMETLTSKIDQHNNWLSHLAQYIQWPLSCHQWGGVVGTSALHGEHV